MKGKKKFLVMLALLAGISASQVFSFGIGVQGGYPGAALTIKLDNPWSFGIGYDYFGSILNPLGFGLNVFADYWFLNPSITSGDSFKLNWFLGIGPYVTTNFFSFGAGARVPVGIQAMIADHIELYLQAVASVGVAIPSALFIDFGVGGNFGFRYHF